MKSFVAILLICFVALCVTQDSFGCRTCQTGSFLVQDYLTYTDTKLLEMLRKLCSKVPTQFEDYCKSAVSLFGQQAIRLLRDAFKGEPREACQRFGLCPRNVTDLFHNEKANQLFFKSLNYITKERKECNLDELRELFYWLPPSIQENIKYQLIGNILGQFPRLKYEVVVKLVNDMFDQRVPAQQVCDDLDRIVLPEAIRRQRCQNMCMDKVDLSPQRILKVIEKCGLTFRCYLEEIAKELQEVARCSHVCYCEDQCKVQPFRSAIAK